MYNEDPLSRFSLQKRQCVSVSRNSMAGPQRNIYGNMEVDAIGRSNPPLLVAISSGPTTSR